MTLSGGVPVKRKKDGKKIDWERGSSAPRIRMSPFSYLQREVEAAAQLAGTSSGTINPAKPKAEPQDSENPE